MGEVGEKPFGPVCLEILDRAVGQTGRFVGEPSAPESTDDSFAADARAPLMRSWARHAASRVL
jgi:hypothetical protein